MNEWYAKDISKKRRIVNSIFLTKQDENVILTIKNITVKKRCVYA